MSNKKNVVRCFVISIAAILLIGCASKKSPSDAATGMDGQLSSAGLGVDSRFIDAQTGLTYTTKAPHDQIFYFRFDNSIVDSKYIPAIEAQARYLAQNPGARILLAGHTDERGSREYNIGLGERRAKSVADIMKMMGFNPNQLVVVSYGKEKPAAVGYDERSHALNRRVELTYEATR